MFHKSSNSRRMGAVPQKNPAFQNSEGSVTEGDSGN
jgi:hypothetical protein